MRICQSCGAEHNQKTSPICGKCRRSNSKKPCPVEGCTELINYNAKTCLKHRRLHYGERFTQCVECGATIDSPFQVCAACRSDIMVLCACGCGRYRKKYGAHGQVCEYISGHNDNWADNRRPETVCAVCGKSFRSSSMRQRLCSLECRTKWLAINPPNERKRVRTECTACGKEIYRQPCQDDGRTPACSKKCRYIIVSNKLRDKPPTDPRRIVLRRDKAKCVLCGFDVLVEVHHIQPRRNGGADAPNNLVCLCPNHHTMADRGLIPPEELQAYVTALEK